jgi:FkbM family methyltransferase
MNSFFKRIKPIVDLTARKKRFQSFYSKLYHLGLYGMNYGVSGDINSNGEMTLLRNLKDRITTPDPVLFDVGANVGEYSNLLGETFPNARIFAFEPSTPTWEVLKGKLAHGHIEAVNAGLSSAIEEVKLYRAEELSSMASVYPRQLGDTTLKKYEMVSLTTLDQFCEERGISFVDFLKVDVEGHELKVFEGATRMLGQRAIRFIQFEFGGTNIDSRVFLRDFINILTPNYRLYRLVTDGLYPVTYGETGEIFTYTNYFAELRTET